MCTRYVPEDHMNIRSFRPGHLSLPGFPRKENLRQRAHRIQKSTREYNPLKITGSRSEEEGEGSREGRRTNPRKLVTELPTPTKCKCWLHMWASVHNIFLSYSLNPRYYAKSCRVGARPHRMVGGEGEINPPALASHWPKAHSHRTPPAPTHFQLKHGGHQAGLTEASTEVPEQGDER